MIDRHFSPRELSELYNIREGTLAAWRLRDKRSPAAPARGPRFTKIGRLVRYAESDVRLWLSHRDPLAAPAAK